MRFIDREAELDTLRQVQRRAERQSQFTVVLGRRRMGKTTLVREFLRGVPRAFYLFVTRKRSEDLRTEFAELLAAEQPALRGARLTWRPGRRGPHVPLRPRPRGPVVEPARYRDRRRRAERERRRGGRVSPTIRDEARALGIRLWEL